MNKVKFANKKEYDLAQPATIETRLERGAQREVMTLTLPAETSIEKILADAQSGTATASITLLTGEDGKTPFVYTDFSVFLSGGLEVQESTAEDGTPQHNTFAVVQLGRLTYIEKQLAALGVKV
ncbi:MAG: hypothetical protein ACK5JF_03885 [Oscillospiraceae bacterium]